MRLFWCGEYGFQQTLHAVISVHALRQVEQLLCEPMPVLLCPQILSVEFRFRFPIDGDGDIDIVAPGKSGLFLFENLLK